jgi:Fe-S-cluster containining protein
MIHHDCEQCGGKCCRNFGVPLACAIILRTTGVPIKLYQSDLDMNPRRYFELHDGVTISDDGERFIVDKRIPVLLEGDRLMVQSVCTNLGTDGRCMDYENRPDMCRNFTAATMHRYCVPDGCKYQGAL